ncbi:MAG: HEAT repeat domain-containing protein, partial [Anaerolineae bacterium]|nr:HEAT repeat domain-containing protein [Anaerolineae bacterium]
MHTPITGHEPRLSTTRAGSRGMQRLSPRRLATLLNVLGPDSISLDAAAAMLHHEGFFVRYNAARLLAERGDREARLILADALENGSAPTRASIARHLGRFSWYVAESLLRAALADPDERVREGAVYALCDLRELAAYRLLTDTLSTETDPVRKAAAWSLRHCHDSAAVPVLAETLRARDPDVRIQALEALSANNTPAAIPV